MAFEAEFRVVERHWPSHPSPEHLYVRQGEPLPPSGGSAAGDGRPESAWQEASSPTAEVSHLATRPWARGFSHA